MVNNFSVREEQRILMRQFSVSLQKTIWTAEIAPFTLKTFTFNKCAVSYRKNVASSLTKSLLESKWTPFMSHFHTYAYKSLVFQGALNGSKMDGHLEHLSVARWRKKPKKDFFKKHLQKWKFVLLQSAGHKQPTVLRRRRLAASDRWRKIHFWQETNLGTGGLGGVGPSRNSPA